MKEELKIFLGRIWEVYKPFRKAMAIMFTLLIFGEMLQLIAPYLHGKILDLIISNGDMFLVIVLATASFILYAIQNVVLGHYRNRFEIENFDFALPRYAHKKSLEKLASFSIGQNTNSHSGIKQSVINQGEGALVGLGNIITYQIIPLVLHFSVIILALFWMNPWISLIVFFCALAFVGITLKINYVLKNKLREHKDNCHDLYRKGFEITRYLDLIQVNAREKETIEQHDLDAEKVFGKGQEMWITYLRWMRLRNLTLGLGRFLVLITGIWCAYSKTCTPGNLVIFLSWSSMAFGRLGDISSLHRKSLELYADLKKYFTLLDIEPDVKTVPNPLQPKKIEGCIEFKNVSFKYPRRSYLEEDKIKTNSDEEKEQETVSNISFKIEAGQTVAFVGHSGACKSTLVNLITRAYDPSKGQITIDGNDLRVLDIKHYRHSIGLVEQDVRLFDHTMKYNIMFGLNGTRANIIKTDLEQISKISGISKFLSNMEKGFDTIIGEKGVKLSGGERQRVGIARAIIKNPRILILDEATSNLDAENEKFIRDSIEKVAKGRTTIIIAHRLSTIKNADKIFVFEHGQLAGEGKHEELMQTCCQYRDLVQQQVG